VDCVLDQLTLCVTRSASSRHFVSVQYSSCDVNRPSVILYWHLSYGLHAVLNAATRVHGSDRYLQVRPRHAHIFTSAVIGVIFFWGGDTRGRPTRTRPGLCSCPRWGSLQHSPNPLVRLRALLLKGRESEGKWYPTIWEKVTPCPSAKLNLQEIFFQ